jgi:hypothetical protein
MAEGKYICIEGFAHREALTSWHNFYVGKELSEAGLTHQHYGQALEDNVQLAHFLYAATSIYLSGIYDYEIGYWQALCLSTPTLEQDEIKRHVETIIHLAGLLLHRTCFSPLLCLFPLRIAGARAWKRQQRVIIVDLLSYVGNSFAAATAIATDLHCLWSLPQYSISDGNPS